MENGIVDIHGKQYKTVALRVSEFRSEYTIRDGWCIVTTVHWADELVVIMRAEIISPQGQIVATGYAEENRTTKGINSTSALENAETSAIGRALAAAGLAGTEYASADEVAGAISQQNNGRRTYQKTTPRPPSNGQSNDGTPSDRQKKFAWSLIQKLPTNQQQEYVDQMRGASTEAASDIIDKLKVLTSNGEIE